MDLVLAREYWPAGTQGTLWMDGLKLALTVEKPAFHFNPPISCLAEGSYDLDLSRTDDRSAVLIFKTRGGIRQRPATEIEIGVLPMLKNIVLVSEITGEGQGNPSAERLEHLIHLIDLALWKGEKTTLEIRSCPEQALNLTYHQIAWMD